MAQFKPQVMARVAPPKAARGGRSPFWFKSIRGLSGVAGIVPPDGNTLRPRLCGARDLGARLQRASSIPKSGLGYNRRLPERFACSFAAKNFFS
jgi:hypothetical protein